MKTTLPPSTSQSLSIQIGNIALHGFSTGGVAVTDGFVNRKGGALLSKVNMLLDNTFTDFMPIWVWVIEHPEGIFVIDTGENVRILEADYFDPLPAFARFVNKRIAQYQVETSQEAGNQLQQLGLSPSQVKAVILTHLHIDHTDGLKDFEGVPVLAYRQEIKHPYNDVPALYPRWFRPEPLDYQRANLGPFEQASPLTQAGDLWLIPLPGHTYHHSGVLLQTPEVHILFAGDTTYTQQQLLQGKVAGVNASYQESLKTYERVKTYARQHPLIYLPSHDPESGQRLAGKSPLYA
jgi:N-acyl homoserine lactone hydrolase